MDLVLAVRPGRTSHKPASKLVNAWHAGTPALLSPDYPYLELRTSELDFMAVSTVTEAEQAITRLRAQPGLYRAMVSHGAARAREFTVAAITDRWAEFLFATVPTLAAPRGRPYWSPVRRRLRAGWRTLIGGLGLTARR